MRGPFVTPIKVTSDDFKNWDKMLDANYKKLASNTTSINHVFTYDVASPGVLATQRVQYSPIAKQWLLKGRKKQINWTEFDHEGRRMLVEASKLEIIKTPLGIYVFGMAKYATEYLHAYVYDEGEGAKGGDNVCSLVYKHLFEEGVIKE